MRGIKTFHILLALLLTAGFSCDTGEPADLPNGEEGKTAVQWRVKTLAFTSEKAYSDPFNAVEMDVVFRHSGGTTLKVPAFWNGGNNWMVRFAPPLTGNWSYTTHCTDESNTGLNHQSGDLTCIQYEGVLKIYKYGFIRTSPGKRYFTYSNGSPFFYLGDTHANIAANDYDNFMTIIDKRAEQGFTVIQSQPLEAGYNLRDGLDENDIIHFKKLDERFQYVAEKGLVHANAQFFFVSTLGYDREKYPDAYLEKLSRYWVARYSAYPVMWTTAQECDDDFNHPHHVHDYYDPSTNPWKIVAGYMHHFDPYGHPLTAHMEYAGYTNASQSAFREVEGHSWWAVQWSARKDGPLNFGVPIDFWENGQSKVSILYEGSFDYLWTNHYGARMQGWTAFLNGMYGYGYGAIDIWLYNSTYDMDQPTTRQGITITVEQKQTKWDESLEFPTAYQLGYMRSFFQSLQWWKLVPRFNDPQWFSNDGSWYSLASEDNDLYVAYFYNPGRNTGTLRKLENTLYNCMWFDPLSGEYTTPETVSVENGTYPVGDKPDENDWVFVMEKF